MKTKKILLLVNMVVFTCLGYAQRIDKQHIFIATSEEDMYKLYNQMLDSARLSNSYLFPGMVERFGISYVKEMENRDTIIKFVQDCERSLGGNYECDRFYWVYISNSMPIDFYERLLDYFKEVQKRENYFLKQESTKQIRFIIDIVIKQYESGTLNKQDSIKARQLIEETLLRIINDRHDTSVMLMEKYDKYMTDKIRQALIHAIKNPFYPTEYLDFYMSHQDTAFLDTTGIPAYIKTKNRWTMTAEEWVYAKRLDSFDFYEEVGKLKYNGLSAGQAYLQGKKDEFHEKGYLPIKYIADYAYQKNDVLLIKHLEKFKKKHLEEYNKQQPSYLRMK